MKNRNTIYFVLIPPTHPFFEFGGMLTLDTEKLSKEMAKEVGGAYIPSSYTLN